MTFSLHRSLRPPRCRNTTPIIFESPHQASCFATGKPESRRLQNKHDSPVLKLTREVRNDIYTYAAKVERLIHLCVGLKKKGQKPQIQVSAVGGLTESCSQIRKEYTEALEAHVYRLTRGGESGGRLVDAGYFVDDGAALLKVSRTQHISGTVTQNTHPSALSIPYAVHRHSGWVYHKHSGPAHKRARSSPYFVNRQSSTICWRGAASRFVIYFADDEFDQLAASHFFEGSVQYDRSNNLLSYWRQEGCTAAVKQLSVAVKTVDWRICSQLLALWYAYAGHIPRLRSDEKYVGTSGRA